MSESSTVAAAVEALQSEISFNWNGSQHQLTFPTTFTVTNNALQVISNVSNCQFADMQTNIELTLNDYNVQNEFTSTFQDNTFTLHSSLYFTDKAIERIKQSCIGRHHQFIEKLFSEGTFRLLHL
jgi:hypothetical protein